MSQPRLGFLWPLETHERAFFREEFFEAERHHVFLIFDAIGVDVDEFFYGGMLFGWVGAHEREGWTRRRCRDT